MYDYVYIYMYTLYGDGEMNEAWLQPWTQNSSRPQRKLLSASGKIQYIIYNIIYLHSIYNDTYIYMDIHGCSMFDSSWLQSMDLFNSSRRQVPTITDVEKS